MVATLNHARNALSSLSKVSDSRAVSIASALLVGIGAWRHYGTRNSPEPFQQEVWIEWISWLLLFAGSRLLRQDHVELKPLTPTFWSSRAALGLTSAVAVGSQLLANCQFPAWIVPLVTVAIMCLEVVTRSATVEDLDAEPKQLEDADSTNEYSPAAARPGKMTELLNLTTPMLLNVFCAAFLAFSISSSHNSLSLSIGALFFMTRSLAVLCLSKLELHEEAEPSSNSTIRLVESIALPSLGLLTIFLLIVRPDLQMSSIEVFGHALAQSVWWLALIVLVRIGYTGTAANADTMGLSAQHVLSETALYPLLTALIAVYGAIVQHIITARPSSAARKIMHAIFALLVLGVWVKQDPRVSVEHVKSTYLTRGHPIENLITKARLHFDILQARQSKTYDEAVHEYRRRYQREPPEGFAKWFSLAQLHDFVLVDEFDTFMNSIEPLYGLDPRVLQHRLNSLIESDQVGDRTGLLRVMNGKMNTTGATADYAATISNAEFMRIIPYNITVILNSWDEPMVSTSWETVRKAVKAAKSPGTSTPFSPSDINENMFIETGGQSGWYATSQACSINSPSRQANCPANTIDTPLSFIENSTAALDVCNNCHILNEHGLLLNPGNLRVSHELIPLWSASKPSHFNDILLPSPYYISVRGGYRPDLDPDWSEKDNKFYWGGSTTGGEFTKSTWRKMQRQRLVLSTNDDLDEPVRLLQESAPGSNRWSPRFSTMKEVANLFITKITGTTQCHEDVCQAMRDAFHLNDESVKDAPEAAYKHRFVMDIDGNGFSGRYYRLLQSKSVVLKSTILQEWHDDRLMPWVHFVPLSTSYSELPEMARYLATTEKGLALSERIARESTEWHNKALRDVDLQIVWTRMLLEYGRLMNRDV